MPGIKDDEESGQKKLYRVKLEGTISTVVVVEADDEKEAEDTAPQEIDVGEIDWTSIEVEEA